jgi:thiamine-phosphate pyrophosphorylase
VIPVLFAVTNDDVVARPEFLDRARAIAQGPRVAIVLRARLDGNALLRLADQLRTLTAASGTRLLIHDRLDVARLSGADGVHLPANGVPTAAARRQFDKMIVGRSTHSPEEALAARDSGADYVFLGSIWVTPSHRDRPPLGLEALALAHAEARRRAGDRNPNIIAIGGVTPERARSARESGRITGVAAIRAVWDAADPALATRELLLSLE